MENKAIKNDLKERIIKLQEKIDSGKKNDLDMLEEERELINMKISYKEIK